MPNINENRELIKCALTGAGAAFGTSNTANVTSGAPLVLKFSLANGIPLGAYLHQLELQFTVLANATTTVTVSLWRAYNTTTHYLTRPIWGYNLTNASQTATPTYDATAAAATTVIASGGGATFNLGVHALRDPNYSTDTLNANQFPAYLQDAYLLIQTNQAGTTTVASASLVVSR